MKSIKARKRHTAEFKAQAIELLALGKSFTERANEICLSVKLFYTRPTSELRDARSHYAGRRVRI